jgi:hypothetical protein
MVQGALLCPYLLGHIVMVTDGSAVVNMLGQITREVGSSLDGWNFAVP